MRLITFRLDGAYRLGVARSDDPNEIVELAEPAGMLSLIDAGEEGMALLRDALASSRSPTHALQDLELMAPLPQPRGNVIGIGRNYQAHAEESARASGKAVDPPTVFTKAVTTVAGPYDDVVIDGDVTAQVDWEVELGVVIGRAGKNIGRERALDHVFGFVVVNDVSARDIQFGWGGQYFKGKSLDGFCRIGPWIVTPDQLTDTRSLRLRLPLNGDCKHAGTRRHMIYP